jgi:hypothetical protein
MSVRTTIDIPEPLHSQLRERAEKSRTSIRALIVHAIEQTYMKDSKGDRVSGPLVSGTGGLGPQFPTEENPHDFIFS